MLQEIARLLVHSLFGMQQGTRLADALEFFIFFLFIFADVNSKLFGYTNIAYLDYGVSMLGFLFS